MLIKHIDLIERRLVNQETIAHEEKVFSLFEPHTELIKKGKTMPPVEFGHRLLVSTDQFQLVVDYRVMEGGSEGAEMIPVADRLLNRFGEGSLASLSTDKGFSSKDERENHDGSSSKTNTAKSRAISTASNIMDHTFRTLLGNLAAIDLG
jgi:IS5 family transposase